LLSLATVLAIAFATPATPDGPIPGATRQLILVVTPEWGSTSGTLRRFERADSTHDWRPVGAEVTVVVGRSGLGWGRGLHVTLTDGPRKVEGDGRAPAGAFQLTEAFGYAPPDSSSSGLPYLQATADLECVDDVTSSYYNRVLDRARVAVDWTSHEEMRRRDVLYRRGVVVAHNAVPIVPGDGSCIFLHVWRGPGSTTSGCTAMAEPALSDAIEWLDAGAAPVLVQLPAGAYRRLRRAWDLPRVTAR
jgi:L,D-peptidoglycan transpeptidase YkuD (ErfK/YbiS/YcfS/YnhG family)